MMYPMMSVSGTSAKSITRAARRLSGDAVSVPNACKTPFLAPGRPGIRSVHCRIGPGGRRHPSPDSASAFLSADRRSAIFHPRPTATDASMAFTRSPGMNGYIPAENSSPAAGHEKSP